MGMFIDRSCVLWQVDEGRGPRTARFSGEQVRVVCGTLDQDGNRGSCFVYDNRKMVEAFCYFRKLSKYFDERLFQFQHYQ